MRSAGCEFEELSLQLRVKGCPAELALKPLEVLLQLLLRAGGAVPKEVLLDSVRPGLNVVDGSLATAVAKLRKALGDENSPSGASGSVRRANSIANDRPRRKCYHHELSPRARSRSSLLCSPWRNSVTRLSPRSQRYYRLTSTIAIQLHPSVA